MRRDPRHAGALPGTGHGPVRLSRRSQLQMDLPDAKHVAVLHERWRAYPRAVDVRAVRRTEVGDLHAVAAAPDPDMAPRNELVRAERRAEPDVPAEHDAPERYGDLTVRAGAGCDDQAPIRGERRHPYPPGRRGRTPAGVLSPGKSQAATRKYISGPTAPR